MAQGGVFAYVGPKFCLYKKQIIDVLVFTTCAFLVDVISIFTEFLNYTYRQFHADRRSYFISAAYFISLIAGLVLSSVYSTLRCVDKNYREVYALCACCVATQALYYPVLATWILLNQVPFQEYGEKMTVATRRYDWLAGLAALFLSKTFLLWWLSRRYKSIFNSSVPVETAMERQAEAPRELLA